MADDCADDCADHCTAQHSSGHSSELPLSFASCRSRPSLAGTASHASLAAHGPSGNASPASAWDARSTSFPQELRSSDESRAAGLDPGPTAGPHAILQMDDPGQSHVPCPPEQTATTYTLSLCCSLFRLAPGRMTARAYSLKCHICSEVQALQSHNGFVSTVKALAKRAAMCCRIFE